MLDLRVLMGSDVRLFFLLPSPPYKYICRHRGLHDSRARQILFSITIVMFVASTGSIISDIQSLLHSRFLPLAVASDIEGVQTINSELDIPQVIFLRVNVSKSPFYTFVRAN